MNTCCFTGRLTIDPELKQTQSGKSVCSFTLAVARPRVKDTTDFINFVVWNQSAEYLCKYGHKGDMVEVVGTLTTRKYEDSNGNKRTAFEVVADSVKLLSKSDADAPKQTSTPYGQSPKDVNFEEMTADDSLPF